MCGANGSLVADSGRGTADEAKTDISTDDVLEIRFVFGMPTKVIDGHEIITNGHCLDRPTVYLHRYTEYFIERTIVHEVLHRVLREAGVPDKFHHFAICQILYG